MCLIDNYELEWYFEHDVLEIGKEHFEAGDEDMEFVEVSRLNYTAFCADIDVVPFIEADTSATCLPIVVIVQNAVKIGPFFNSTLPVFES